MLRVSKLWELRFSPGSLTAAPVPSAPWFPAVCHLSASASAIHCTNTRKSAQPLLLMEWKLSWPESEDFHPYPGSRGSKRCSEDNEHQEGSCTGRVGDGVLKIRAARLGFSTKCKGKARKMRTAKSVGFDSEGPFLTLAWSKESKADCSS